MRAALRDILKWIKLRVGIHSSIEMFQFILSIKYTMIPILDQLEVSLDERLDHLAALSLDSTTLSQTVKDEERRRHIVRNFRLIKEAEKSRNNNENRLLKGLERVGSAYTKAEVIAAETMLANCINQYINADYEAKKTGDPLDLVDVFLFYYEQACFSLFRQTENNRQIKASVKVQQLTVIRNCKLFSELPFLQDNLNFVINNMRSSLLHLYETEKNRFLGLVKVEGRSFSPEKRGEEEQEERFDVSGRSGNKKRLQQYCWQLSRVLGLQGLYINYFYFNSMDAQKRKKSLQVNFMKRNLHIQRIMSSYCQEYKNYKEKNSKNKP